MLTIEEANKKVLKNDLEFLTYETMYKLAKIKCNFCGKEFEDYPKCYIYGKRHSCTPNRQKIELTTIKQIQELSKTKKVEDISHITKIAKHKIYSILNKINGKKKEGINI